MKNKLLYPFEVRWSDEDGAYIAEAYDLPLCAADGATPQEAIRELGVAIEGWIAVAKKQGDEIPPPSTKEPASGKLLVRMSRDLHRRLRREAKRQGVSLNDWVVERLASR